jgi:glucosyl-dolichyl phosphate glucuronosyltransferase
MISVIIATCGRIDSLRRLLYSLRNLNARQIIDHEVLIVNNVGDDSTAASVEQLVKDHAQYSIHCVHLREPVPGKSRSVNRAMGSAKGAIWAFVDDDVTLDADWLVETQNFFSRHSFDAMQGAIHFPKELEGDETFLRAWNRFRTIPHTDWGPNVKEIHHLTGANIALRREVIDRIGPFNERLGPGEAGTSEDFELAQRIIRSKMRIGYAPRSVVYHEVDWNRLSESYFRRIHEAQGRSRQLFRNSSLLTIVSNYMRSTISFGWYSLVRKEREKYRSKGRCYHYRAMLAAKLATIRSAASGYPASRRL